MWKTTLQLLVLQLCSTSFGLGNEQRVVVTEGSDAVLPCSVRDQDLTYKVFDWKKDDQQEVFLYDAGIHYNNDRRGQDPQFKGRVSHFQDELKHGNASIKIRDIKVEDSGNYSCYFPRLQSEIFHIKLLVAAPEPHITILNVTEEGVRLQCHVPSASSEPTVEWQNGDGNVLHAEEPQVSGVKGRFSVTLLTTVTSSGHFRCVVTQEEIQHQVYSETHVYFREELRNSYRSVIWSVLGGIFTGVFITCLTLHLQKNIHLTAKKGSERNGDNNYSSPNSVRADPKCTATLDNMTSY